MSDEELLPGSASAEPIGVPVFSTSQLRRARDLLARIYGLRRTIKLYEPGHPAVRAGVEAMMDVLGRYFAEGVDVPLTFFEDELLLGDQLLPEESILFDQLGRDMAATGATNVTFLRGLSADELERAMRVLSMETPAIQQAGGLEALIAEADLRHVRVASVRVVDRAEASMAGAGRAEARAAYGVALELLRELERVVSENGVLPANRVRATVRTLVMNVLHNRPAMLELSGLKSYDEYTFHHSVNVAILSLALGSLVSRDMRFLSSLGVGALMHDLGKIGLDLRLLNKPGRLTAEEWELVRRHPVDGAVTAATIQGLDKSAVVVILEHHMRLDLTGYPRRQSSRPQHLASRIVAVADAYDAMTSRRSYSAPRLPDEALAILVKNAGYAFDPVLVRLFTGLLGVYPPRSVVRLTGGETAVVVEAGPDPVRPRVRVFTDAEGNLIEPHDLDLSETPGPPPIERCLDAEGLNVDVEAYL